MRKLGVVHLSNHMDGNSYSDSVEDGHRDFYLGLSREEKQLILLRDELYKGSWEEMEGDMRDRLSKKPYILKLMERIEQDLVRIQKLRGYEREHGINLGGYAEEEAREKDKAEETKY